MLASASFIDPDHDPMAIAALAYVVYNFLLIMAGAVALGIVKVLNSPAAPEMSIR